MGLLKTAAKVAVASSVHGRVQRRQQQRWAEQDQRAASSSTSVQAAGYGAPQAGSADLSQQLELIRQLNELRESGALSDAEFEAKKAQILHI
jgi:transposase-like protein